MTGDDTTLNGSIKMICEKHNAPAVFYSEPLGKLLFFFYNSNQKLH
jgi:hypothetical protein